MIAIGIPALNLLDYTKFCVESILRHSGRHPFRLLLLDNGSKTREVFDYMKAVEAWDPRALAIRNETNRWVYGAWNQLTALALDAGADLVCYMSNDVQVGERWLDGIMREFLEDRMAGRKRYYLLNGQFHDHAAFDQEVSAFLRSVEAQPGVPRTSTGRCGWAFFVPKEAIPLFYPIPETLRIWYGDDWVHFHLKKAGYECVRVLDSCAIHFGSKTLESMDQGEKNRIIAQDRVEYHRLTGEFL